MPVDKNLVDRLVKNIKKRAEPEEPIDPMTFSGALETNYANWTKQMKIIEKKSAVTPPKVKVE